MVLSVCDPCCLGPRLLQGPGCPPPQVLQEVSWETDVCCPLLAGQFPSAELVVLGFTVGLRNHGQGQEGSPLGVWGCSSAPRTFALGRGQKKGYGASQEL